MYLILSGYENPMILSCIDRVSGKCRWVFPARIKDSAKFDNFQDACVAYNYIKYEQSTISEVYIYYMEEEELSYVVLSGKLCSESNIKDISLPR